MDSFDDKNDVLALLIHLGYLAYNPEEESAEIPNEEIRTEFQKAVQSVKWTEILDFLKESERLLAAVNRKDNNEVAKIIEAVHDTSVSILQYNDENSLSYVLDKAFLGTMNFYFKPKRELPAGKGFADIVYIPKPEYRKNHPSLVVELKWNQEDKTAIDQIKKKQYQESIKEYTDNILFIGINYDRKSKKHECLIEEFKN